MRDTNDLIKYTAILSIYTLNCKCMLYYTDQWITILDLHLNVWFDCVFYVHIYSII